MPQTSTSTGVPPDLDDGELHPYCTVCGQAAVDPLPPAETAHWDPAGDDDHTVELGWWPPRPAVTP